MNRAGKIILIVFAALLLGCGVFFLCVPRTGTTALIYADGELCHRVALDAVTAPYTIEVGAGNVALVEPGGISMHSADCPDQLCVKQGRASVAMPVVCLPNRVTIIVESPGGDDVDIVAGAMG